MVEFVNILNWDCGAQARRSTLVIKTAVQYTIKAGDGVYTPDKDLIVEMKSTPITLKVFE